MERMAAMKKVLSPISESMIVMKERMRASAERSVGAAVGGGCVDIVYEVVGVIWEPLFEERALHEYYSQRVI